jgi:hypothetical protein
MAECGGHAILAGGYMDEERGLARSATATAPISAITVSHDRCGYRRGNKQTVEVRHVHIHSGAKGVVGIVNATEKREGDGEK